MTDKLRDEMGKAAVKAAEYIKYEGVGTVEFLVDKNRKFYFMEMNTRIQVEHPITEQVIDYDLIREQIMVAAGVKISGKNYMPQLHSIECRINAEDPFNDFRPSPGKITNLHLPGGHGIRIDTHVYSGYTIPPNYDSMIAKLITTAQTREEAIDKMKRALDEFVIEGIKTTIPFHRKLMDSQAYIEGNYTTKFMETFQWKINMKKIVVLGCGLVGRVMAEDLSQTHKVTSVDISQKNLDNLKSESISKICKDVSDSAVLNEIIKDCDLVVGALPGFMGYETMKRVIMAKKNIVDISFYPEDPFGLDKLAKDNNVIAVMDCGVAPGMGNIIFSHHDKMMKISDYECLVGGLPKRENGLLNIRQFFLQLM